MIGLKLGDSLVNLTESTFLQYFLSGKNDADFPFIFDIVFFLNYLDVVLFFSVNNK